MKLKLVISVILWSLFATSYGQNLKKVFKFSTFYVAANGGNSISDQSVYSVNGSLGQNVIQTPFDYSLSAGIRKIARFGYENRANVFYDGTESTWSDAATLGKVDGLEFLFEADYRRQIGNHYIDMHHFIRYVGEKYVVKGEYLQEGFADIKYFETSERFRLNLGKKLSLNVGAVQRLAEPYGYDPLAEWLLDNGNIHYTQLAIQEGYNIDVFNSIYNDPNGEIVATNAEVWEAVVIPQVLNDYVSRKRWEFDFYHYKKDFWLHSWGNIMPYHYDDDSQFAYHKFVDGQWIDYSGGVIFGWKVSKHLGAFIEGKYNKYWNREWYDFKFGANYIIF
mgnify:CR=1 FL=1